MASFRIVGAVAAALALCLFGADIKTVSLNATLAIPQYLRVIDGFPCDVEGHIYVIKRTLYGLRQLGRE
ncbi:TPA: hypothetical protein N0F65_010835 [Lagenidium giganteum]|uniref:Uncharacterized protein n=1 Tax=Lagenidium giganteum TaxID=4803 RepID=A0AAV2Z1M4_9STRA|nr:TPA: hypothetical protein N0F65_010835 [Lagenidium giganteum]